MTDFDRELQETRESFEIIFEENKTPDYTEIKGETGGDVFVRRVYNNGAVYAK